jgi:hypothetical protein
MPARRDPVAELEQLLKVEEPGDENVRRHLAEHWSTIAPVLGAGSRKFEDLELSSDELLRRLRYTLSEKRKEHARAKVTMARARALSCADELARSATWNGEIAILEPSLLFGGLLSDASTRYVGFVISQDETVNIFRSKLADASHVFRYVPDLCVTLDNRALHLGWHGGRGRLNLISQPVPAHLGQQVLYVPLERPAITPEPEVAPEPMRELRRRTNHRRGLWLRDVLAEFGMP